MNKLLPKPVKEENKNMNGSLVYVVADGLLQESRLLVSIEGLDQDCGLEKGMSFLLSFTSFPFISWFDKILFGELIQG